MGQGKAWRGERGETGETGEREESQRRAAHYLR